MDTHLLKSIASLSCCYKNLLLVRREDEHDAPTLYHQWHWPGSEGWQTIEDLHPVPHPALLHRREHSRHPEDLLQSDDRPVKVCCTSGSSSPIFWFSRPNILFLNLALADVICTIFSIAGVTSQRTVWMIGSILYFQVNSCGRLLTANGSLETQPVNFSNSSKLSAWPPPPTSWWPLP